MPEPPDGEVSHRPLPSVGIPLLRKDLRRSRARRWVAVSLVMAVVTAVGIAALTLPSWLSESPGAPAAEPEQVWAETVEPELEPAADAVEPTVSQEALPDGTGTRTVRRFGEARGFRPALTSAGLSGEEADAVVNALGAVMDFRRCRPEHELVLERAEDGLLRRFEYRASATHVYEAVRTEAGVLQGRQVPVPIQRTRLALGGTIRSSLGAALERAGLGRSLVGVFVEVFAREVSFATDTRAGDTFRIIVEEERIAGDFLRYGTVHGVEIRGQRFGQRRAFWFEPRPELADFYDTSGRAVHGGWLRTPLRYDHISSPFDPRRRHPILRRIVPHNGVDYAAPTGTPVWAAAEGVVTFVGNRGANGNLVSIRHENGYETHYAHLSRFATGLAAGARVRQREVIGYVGSTGRSTGPHLHFGLEHNGRFIDPQAELNGPGRMMPSTYLTRFRRQMQTLETELDRISVAPAQEETPEEEPPAPPSAMD